jgi:hypothetical protein
MKKLKELGKTLSKQEQKNIKGGVAGDTCSACCNIGDTISITCSGSCTAYDNDGVYCDGGPKKLCPRQNIQ